MTATATEQPRRDRAAEALADIVQMFESGTLPEAIAQTRLLRERDDRPLCTWSLGNQLLTFFAGTDDARGFRQWQDAGRKVKKGARAFTILAPCTRKVADTDATTGEETSRVVVVGFKGIPVFRIEDTEGDPIEYPDYEPAERPPLAEVAERLGVQVRYLPSGGSARGSYSLTSGDITLATHDVDTFFHELAHAAHATVEPLKGGQQARQEIIAETVSAVLCRLYGYDGYIAEAFDYVAFYGKDPGKSVVQVIATVGKVLDVILGVPDGTGS